MTFPEASTRVVFVVGILVVLVVKVTLEVLELLELLELLGFALGEPGIIYYIYISSENHHDDMIRSHIRYQR